jgi:hypothetical protein
VAHAFAAHRVAAELNGYAEACRDAAGVVEGWGACCCGDGEAIASTIRALALAKEP